MGPLLYIKGARVFFGQAFFPHFPISKTLDIPIFNGYISFNLRIMGIMSTIINSIYLYIGIGNYEGII